MYGCGNDLVYVCLGKLRRLNFSLLNRSKRLLKRRQKPSEKRLLLVSEYNLICSRQYHQGSIKENWEGLVAVVARVAQWLWRLQPDTLGSSPSAPGFSPFSPFLVEQAEEQSCLGNSHVVVNSSKKTNTSAYTDMRVYWPITPYWFGQCHISVTLLSCVLI